MRCENIWKLCREIETLLEYSLAEKLPTLHPTRMVWLSTRLNCSKLAVRGTNCPQATGTK